MTKTIESDVNVLQDKLITAYEQLDEMQVEVDKLRDKVIELESNNFQASYKDLMSSHLILVERLVKLERVIVGQASELYEAKELIQLYRNKDKESN